MAAAAPWSFIFATSRLDDTSLLNLPSLGRPTIVAVRIGRAVVRIPVTRRANRVIRIATKTQALRHLHFTLTSPASGATVPMPGLAGRHWISAAKIDIFTYYHHYALKFFFDGPLRGPLLRLRR